MQRKTKEKAVTHSDCYLTCKSTYLLKLDTVINSTKEQTAYFFLQNASKDRYFQA